MTQLPDAVLDAYGAGFNVVPADMDKKPKIPWKELQDRRQTPEDLALLGHGSLWAVVTGPLSNVVVLDFDGPEGLETMRALGLEAHVRTAAGAHVYVTHPGRPVKSSAKAFPLYPGLDIKGDKSLAYFYGRSKKGEYTPEQWPPWPVILEPGLEAELFPYPESDNRQAADPSEYTGYVAEAERYLRRCCDDIRISDPGSSNSALNKAAYSLGGLIAAGQLEESAVRAALLEAAEERGCGTPGPVIDSSIATGLDAPWKMTPVTAEDEWVPSYAVKFLSGRAAPEAVEFPIGVFPETLARFIEDGSKAVSCPPDYIGTALLPALGVGIGGHVSLRVTETWSESALVWAAIVGKPGAAKSPAINLVMKPVREAENAYERAAAEEARRREEDDGEYVEIRPPRLIVDDATIEALFGVHEANPRGLVLQPDELIGWVKGMGQYKGGLGRDRQHWLSVWSRGDVRVDRATSKNRKITKPFVSVLGGIQPEPLEELVCGLDDGLVPRLLMAQGETGPRRLRRGALDPSITEEWSRIWYRLHDRGLVERTVNFTDDGYLAFETWVNQHYDTVETLPKELVAAWSKMDGQCARICLILAELDGTDVTEGVVRRAVALVRYYQGQSAQLLQGAGGQSSWEKRNAGRTKVLAGLIQENPGVTRGELLLKAPGWALDLKAFDRHLETLRAMGLWTDRQDSA